MNEGPVGSEVSPKEVLEAGTWLLGELGKIGLDPDKTDLLYERFVGGFELDGEASWDMKKGIRPMAGAARRLEKIKKKEKANPGLWDSIR